MHTPIGIYNYIILLMIMFICQHLDYSHSPQLSLVWNKLYVYLIVFKIFLLGICLKDLKRLHILISEKKWNSFCVIHIFFNTYNSQLKEDSLSLVSLDVGKNSQKFCDFIKTDLEKNRADSNGLQILGFCLHDTEAVG